MVKPRHIKLTYVVKCPQTGKLGYIKRSQAREARRWSRLLSGEKTSEWSVYRCPHCEYWHIGHNYKHRNNRQEGDAP